MRMFRLLGSKFGPQVLAGVAAGRVNQQADGDTTVQTLVTILVLMTIFLPIAMAIFGGVVMRFLAWFSREDKVGEDEVVMPAPTLPAGVHLPDPTIFPAVLAFGLMGVMFGVALQSWIVLIAAALVAALGLGGWVWLEIKDARPRH